MIIASIEGFFGTVFFAGIACLVGYIAGHVFPISKISDLIKK